MVVLLLSKLSSGYQVYGYDGILQKFNIIPSNTTGGKTNLILGNVPSYYDI
jgi:hypothetical protein